MKFKIAFYDKGSFGRNGEEYLREEFKGINKTLPDAHVTVSLQDLASVMVTSKQSLETLNSNLLQNNEKPIQAKTFRGNIQVDTFSNKPWQEEQWSEIFIGKNNSTTILKSFMRCVRCVSTTIDPDTAKLRKDLHPLKFLRKNHVVAENEWKVYGDRAVQFGSYFGIKKGCSEECDIRIGDVVYAKY